MATHARQQYFADESSLSKEKREFSIADEIQQKIDSIEEGAQVNTIETIKVNGAEVEPDENKAVDLTIPGVVDSLDSISSTDALSAKQGKVLYDYIQDVSHIGHFLALWNASTGLPVTDPETSPYIYNTGDFYTVSVVAPQGGTNYRPDGTQYVIGQASTTVDTDDVEVNDFYFYDGTTWRHMKNSGAGSIAIDGSLSTSSTNPVENRVITNALNGKQSTLIAGSNIQIAQDGKTISATDTKYTAGTGINIDTNNVINADTSVLATKTELSTKQDKLIAGNNIQIASDGKTISATDTKYTAGENIEISSVNEISAPGLQEELTAGDNITIEDICTTESDMKGPAPSGFHVPLNSEWAALCGILTDTFSMARNATTMCIYLKMPLAGSRNYSSARVSSQGDFGFYRSSSHYDANSAYCLYFTSTALNPRYIGYRAYGYSVRCFKNSPVIPDSSWTTLYDGSSVATDAGIFRNSSLGLISASGDGVTWYTIQDKNLGATTVYNDGDALVQANMGNMYQWGNNYGFQSTGNITTSSTQADASIYGPGNYYSSDTFITGSGNWSSVQNDNLWGGVTQGTWQDCDLTISANTEWGNITGTLSDQADLQTVLNAKQDNMVILKYGISTRDDFITAYNKNGVIYCRASSNSNPASGSQTRLAFMAYVNNETAPTEVEFQYYRSRSSHNTAATALDEVYVYKLVPADGGTWTVTQRDTAAKPLAGTGIGLTYNASGMTISADTTVLATKTDLNSKQDTISDLAAIRTGAGLGATALQPGDDVSELNNDAGYITNSYHDSTKQDKLIAGDNIQISSSNVISATDTKYNAGAGISIGNVTKNGRQGPSPDGFHIPSVAEWQGLNDIMYGLSLNTGDSWRINLHMPFAKYRIYTDASLDNQGSGANFWSSSPNPESSNEAYCFFMVSPFGGTLPSSRANGIPIRCFKDSYMIPDSTWIVVQGTLGSAGIFWNQSEGLISITDGTTGYTIMDKNLGATTVYNDGDTLTQANMGNMYQWGNNYGFPSTGTITNISSTQVDASSYGPGNYYSSDTYIIGSTDWSSVHNDDLWGDTTGTITIENVISNAGVISVNGQTGDVTVSNTEYTAGEGIEIKNLYDYSAMQGPAPTGYHVPLGTEREAVYNIWTALGGGTSAGVNFGTTLKMPRAGLRYNSSSSEGLQGTNGNYWSSTAYSSDSAYCLLFTNSGIRSQLPYKRSYGFSVRCFKNSPVVPDTSWTMLYGTSIDAGGIFWNSTDGLISMSSDGTTWITIQDKNLGATQVRNSGDTLSRTNCGGFFQWGNNYMFPFAGSVTTSSTQVDASSYGPGNYYSSSTFINGNDNWSNVQNDNLRGGVTGVITINNAITNTGVLSVNGQTGDVTIAAGLQVAPNSPITGIKYIRYGTEAQYAALTQYYTNTPGDTEFHCF